MYNRQPLVRELMFPLDAFVCQQHLVTERQRLTFDPFVVLVTLVSLLSRAVLLSQCHGTVQVFQKGFHIGIIVTHSHIMEHVLEEKVNWQPRDSPEHQVEWREPGGLMNSAIVYKGHGLDHLRPLLFGAKGQRSQHVPQGAVKPLRAAVPHRMVRRGVGFVNS